MEKIDLAMWNEETLKHEGKCWDCGSDRPHHHTPKCDFAADDAILDLPEIPGTQWWDKEAK